MIFGSLLDTWNGKKNSQAIWVWWLYYLVRVVILRWSIVPIEKKAAGTASQIGGAGPQGNWPHYYHIKNGKIDEGQKQICLSWDVQGLFWMFPILKGKVPKANNGVSKHRELNLIWVTLKSCKHKMTDKIKGETH